MALRSRSFGSNLFDLVNCVLIVCFCITVILPFWLEIVISVSRDPATLPSRLIPSQFTLAAYKKVFTSATVFTGYFNTLKRTAVGTVLSIVFTFFGAYALTKKDLPFRSLITVFFLITMFFSGGLIPSYLLIRRLGLIDNFWALILPGLTNVWFILIARNFLSTVPVSLEESALIDGAGYLTILSRIVVPLSKPIIATIALWTAVSHWNAWFDALIYIRSPGKFVLQLMLRRIFIGDQSIVRADFSQIRRMNLTPESLRAAIVMVTIGPIIFAYPFLQKYFIKGILIGSLKG